MSKDTTSLEVHKEFEDLINEINFSRELLELNDNWDDDGAKEVDTALYNTSIAFLVNYALFVWQTYNIAIQAPEINACPSGSIDLSWRTQEARLLINIRHEGGNTIAAYYGDSKDGRPSVKGVLDVNTIDKDFASWLRLLKN